MQAGGFARCEPWFYLRLGTDAGLTLFLVLRGGLGSAQCLGDCAPGEQLYRDFPPHHRPGPWSRGRGKRSRTIASGIRRFSALAAPNMASAQEIKERGHINLSQFPMKLLEKIEELTLYTVAQEKKIAELTLYTVAQEKKIAEFQSRLEALEKLPSER